MTSFGKFGLLITRCYYRACDKGLNFRQCFVSGRRFSTENPVEDKRSFAQRFVNAIRRGPVSWKNFGLSLGTGVVLGVGSYYFVQHLKKSAQQAKKKRIEAGFGRPSIGGEWRLTDYDGNVKTFKDYLGKWVLIYFGFTHCPDVCPAELEKLCKVVNAIDNDPKYPNLVSLFFTVDPIRDTPEKLKKYCQEYSPKLLGLTGTVDEVQAVCKMFRVYFGLGPKDLDGDYIVDHTVVIYLMDPNGRYCDHFTMDRTPDAMEQIIRGQIDLYNKRKK